VGLWGEFQIGGKAVIEVKDLTKYYGKQMAVENLNFTLESGQVYGLLGPNGAGKSTTMNIMAGCLSATEGTVVIEGHDVYKESRAARRCVGYLPELPPLYVDMTPYEYLQFVAQAKGFHGKKAREEACRVMEVVHVMDVKDRLIKTLSKGYKQRVGIAMALVGNPKLIILDEPTVGLDPKQIIEIRDLIRSLRKKHTIILSSHILPEVSSVCDQIYIINKGKLIVSDTPKNLSSYVEKSGQLHLTVRGSMEQAEKIFAHNHCISMEPSAEVNSVDVVLQVPDSEVQNQEFDIRDEIFKNVARAGCTILAMNYEQVSLEDIYLELTAREATVTKENAEAEVDIETEENEAEQEVTQ
jgi:ABC-2 type transport system ATP-binding protein